MNNIFIFSVILLLNQNSLVFSSSGIPGSDLPKHIRTGYDIARSAKRDHLSEYVELVRPKLSKTLRNIVPGELILSSGFLTKDQDPLDMAGCYIRLGQNFRQYESLENRHYFSSLSFLNAGSTYARIASELNELRKQAADADITEVRINFLLSSAQCYYWAGCNEPDLHKKEIEKRLAINYLECAISDANLLPTETKVFWFDKIDRERAKLF